MVIAQIFFSCTYGPAPAIFSGMFGHKVRYSGVSLRYQIGAVTGGAFAPLIATALYTEFGSSNAVALYVAAVALVSLVSVWLISHSHTETSD